METMAAVSLVNSATFKPGWSFRAAPGLVVGEIDVECTIRTVDTSRPSRDGEYVVPKVLEDEFSVKAARLTGMEILFFLLKRAREMDVHEDREFLRIPDGRGGWVAPFHPHTDDGNYLWESISTLDRLVKMR